MGRFLVLISIFLSLGARAAVPGNAPILTIAAPGQNTQSLSIPLSSLSGSGVNGVFSLFGGGSSTTATDYYPLYKNGVAYFTGATTKAYCFNISYISGNTPSSMQLVSSTAAITAGSSSLTSGKYQGGISGTYVNTVSTSATTFVPQPGEFVIGDGVNVTYAGYQPGNSYVYYIFMQCYEQ
jgi:hypothetical protein